MGRLVVPWAAGQLYGGGTLGQKSVTLLDNNNLVIVQTSQPQLPAATVTVTFSVNGSSGDRNFMAGIGSTEPIDLDGGTWRPVNGATSAPPGATTWSPTWALPAGWDSLAINSLGTSGQIAISFTDPVLTDVLDGDRTPWDRVGLGSTTGANINHMWLPMAGPWQPGGWNTVAGSKLVVEKVFTGTRTVTVPLFATGVSSYRVAMAALGGGSSSLISDGGATDNGDGTLTLDVGTRRFPEWSVSGGASLSIESISGGGGSVAYSPLYIEVPPTPPTITKLIPTAGPDTGGTPVDIIGANLTGATTVDFGSTPGTGLTVDPSGGLATVTSPAHTAGPAPVTITTPAGTSAAETFTFEAPLPPGPPTITKLIPTSGPDTGGTTVDIIGANLTGATAVDFGSTPGTGLTVDPSGNLATVTSPAHTAGPAPVTITTPAGVSNAETFTFEAPPVVTVPVIVTTLPSYLCADSADPSPILVPVIFPFTDVVSAAVGGVTAAVGGVTDFGGGGGGVGAVFISPPSLSPGTYDLILTNSAGSSDPYPIEYVDCSGGCPPDPTVVAVFPGAARPGATIQIVGTNLTDATVTMCGDPVAIVSNDGTIITVVVPPGCPDGPATITVTTPDGETTVEFTVLPPEPVPPADVSPRSWQIAQALLDAAFLCGAECARAFVTTDATPEGPPPGGCPCQLTATIVKDGYKTADGRRLVRSATIKLSLHQCTPIPQADEIPDPDTESDYALRQAETRDQMLRGLATARRQPSSVLGRCQTKQASEGWVHVSTTGGMSLYTMEVTVD